MGLALVPDTSDRQTGPHIPLNPKKRGEWFHNTYGLILQSHIDILVSICGDLKKGQGISFTEIKNGYVQAHYGKYSIYFPADIDTKGIKKSEWINKFDLLIDGNTVPIDTGISVISPSIEIVAKTTSRISGVINTLLPPKIQYIPTTSRNIQIKRSISVQPKNK